MDVEPDVITHFEPDIKFWTFEHCGYKDYTHPELSEDNLSEKCGYKDSIGNVIVQPKYDRAKEFSQGVAIVNIGGRYV